MNRWMWRLAEAEAEVINRRAPRSKRGTNQAQNRPGRSPCPFRSGSTPSRSLMLLGQLLTCSLMHLGPWRCFLHSLDRALYHASFSIFCLGPWSFRHHASVPGPFGVMLMRCLDLCQASWSSLEVLDELIPKVSSLTLITLHKQQTPKSTCESELETSGGLVPLVRISTTCKCWW
jgi:hypothetical protein